MDKLGIIASKLIYREDIEITTMMGEWKQLGVTIDEIEPGGNKSIVITHNNLHDTYEFMKHLKEKSIPTDCRFFAMFMSNLYTDPDIKNMFLMHFTLKSIEIMVPQNCLYITLDTDLFVLKKESETPENITSGALGSNQGQWVFNNNKGSYIGIGNEGVIELELNKWVERYSSLVKKHTDNDVPFSKEINLKNIYTSLLKSLVAIHGIQVGVYEFEDLTFRNILVEPI